MSTLSSPAILRLLKIAFYQGSKTISLTSLAAAALLALSGCAAVQVKLGMKVPLPKILVASIDASQPKGPGIGPGQKSSLMVNVIELDGKESQTEGVGKGKVMWSDLRVTATVVTVNKKGVVTLPKDPRVSDGKIPHVTVSIPSHPGVHSDLDIPLRYDYRFVSDFSGGSGSNGMNGTDGSDGMNGRPGSLDPNKPSAGGNGSNGGNGSDGGNGGAGEDAPPVQIQVTLRPGSHPLLQASVSVPGHKRLYLVDPQGGSLTVTADGGSGGSGGKGGRAGHGGSGGIGSPNGSNGMDGHSGQDGLNGPSGRGGSITITYEPQVKPYLTDIHLSNQGGPKSVFKEEPVAPLW